MDFFAHQDRARKKTGLLIFYFLSAIILLIGSLYAVIALILQWQRIGFGAWPGTVFSPTLLVAVSIFVLLVVITGSLYKIFAIRKGGESVALAMGARWVNPQTTGIAEKRLLNVVEEIAIASGTAMPKVFVLPEQGINAFAAGFTVNDAIIAVTRGAMETLNRDELQGVIAHEFSHILNGDMRLNIQLMGVVHGLIVLSTIGFYILRGGRYGSFGGSSRKKGGKGGLAIILIAFALMVIGYIGVIFGKLIKSAISRQREFLADASSVQFTRNPVGISGALKKIGGWARTSKIRNPGAEEVSHFFFANALGGKLGELMSTHPPLRERIKRIDPAFDGVYPQVKTIPISELESSSLSFTSGSTSEKAAFSPSEVTASIGNPGAEHIKTAASILSAAPKEIKTAVQEPYGMRAAIFLLLLDKRDDIRGNQIAYLSRAVDFAIFHEFSKLLPFHHCIKPEVRLPLVDLAIPVAKTLSAEQYKQFKQHIQELINADHRIDVFEFMLQQLLTKHCDPVFEQKSTKPRLKYTSLLQVLPECTALLSVLAWRGSGGNEQPATDAFKRAFVSLGAKKESGGIFPQEKSGIETLRTVFHNLNECVPLVKKAILNACSVCILADRRVTIEEVELLRTIGDALDSPIPPLLRLGGQKGESRG